MVGACGLEGGGEWLHKRGTDRNAGQGRLEKQAQLQRCAPRPLCHKTGTPLVRYRRVLGRLSNWDVTQGPPPCSAFDRSGAVRHTCLKEPCFC